jgi:hypothetical protein
MIKRDTYKEITSGTSAGATQTEIYEIFEGTNTQGQAQSLFDTTTNISLADLIYLIKTYVLPNANNGETIANQLSETLSGGDTIISNLLVDTISGSTYSQANLSYLNFIENSGTNGHTANIENSNANIENNTLNSANSLSTIETNTGAQRTPVIISTSASGTITPQIHNISFYNSGSATGTITINGTTINIPAGVSINYDAGGNNNRYAGSSFSYNGTGTTLLISYTQ